MCVYMTLHCAVSVLFLSLSNLWIEHRGGVGRRKWYAQDLVLSVGTRGFSLSLQTNELQGKAARKKGRCSRIHLSRSACSGSSLSEELRSSVSVLGVFSLGLPERHPVDIAFILPGSLGCGFAG